MPFNYTHAFVTLATTKFERLVSFYCQLLGQDPLIYQSQVYAEFELQGLRLGIFCPKHQQEFTQVGSGQMSLCLEVEEIESATRHLTQLGYPPPGAMITASHGKEIYAYDPDGNRLILHQTNSYSQLR